MQVRFLERRILKMNATTKTTLFVSLLLVSAVILSACGPSQADFNAQQTQIAELNAKLTTPTPSNEELQEQIQNLQEQLSATPASSSVTPTPLPTKGASAQPAGSCPQARDLGPWAPTASGEGITFEVTASDQGASNLSSNGVVLGLWWPAGNTSWGKQEITTFVPRGMSITVVAGAGRGWDYEATCPSAEINRQMEEHMSARVNDTSYHGFVPLADLISAGLVEVRFDRSQNPTP